MKNSSSELLTARLQVNGPRVIKDGCRSNVDKVLDAGKIFIKKDYQYHELRHSTQMKP